MADEKIESVETEVKEVLDEVLPDPSVSIETAEDEGESPPAKPGIAAATGKQPRLKTLTAEEIAKKQKEARIAGQKTLRDSWDAKAKAKGFTSVEEMLEKTAGRGEPDASQVRINSPTVQAELTKRDQLISKLQRENRTLMAKLDAQDTELALRHEAYSHGVNADDIEYATTQLHKKWSSLDAETQKTFKPETFFSELKGKKPHLFGGGVPEKKVEEVITTTSPVTGNAPRTPKAGDVKVEESAEKKPRDMRKASREDYLEALTKMGVKNPASLV